MTTFLRSLSSARLLVASITAVAALLATSVSACSDASGEMSGGSPLFDAGPAPVPTNGDSGPLGCGRADGGTGSTWTELYTDYFGKTGGANCSGVGSCHADENGAGFQSSNFACGADKDSCFTSITGKDAELLVPGDSVNPAGSGLVNDLRKATAKGTNNMPQTPLCEFTDADMKRIEAWISAGMKND